MTGMTFDAFTRRAAEAIFRRRSLLALSAATVGAAALPGSVQAGKCSKQSQQKIKKLCQRQAEQCVGAVESLCGMVSNAQTRQECLDSCLPACTPAADCLNGENFESLITCAIFL